MYIWDRQNCFKTKNGNPSFNVRLMRHPEICSEDDILHVSYLMVNKLLIDIKLKTDAGIL